MGLGVVVPLICAPVGPFDVILVIRFPVTYNMSLICPL